MELSYDQMRTFAAVVRHGSFSRAGAALLRSQSAVSVAVAKLEEAVGQRLLHRTTKRVALTEAGEVLLRYTRAMERQREQAVQELEDLHRMERGRLVLSASDTIGCYALPAMLQLYRERHPGIEIVIRNATSPRTIRSVLDHEVDLGIVTLGAARAGLESIPLFRRRDVLICPPDHRLARRRRIRFKDLERESFILLDPYCSSRHIVDEVCAEARVDLHIAMELSSIEVIKRFVRTGAGLSVVPEMAVREEIAEGVLAAVRIADFEDRPYYRMGAIYRQDRYLSIAAQSFLDALRAQFAVHRPT